MKLEMLKFSVIFFALLYYNFYLYFFISKLPMVGMNRTVMTGSGWTLKKPVNAVTQPEVIISKIATVQLLPYTVHQEYFFHRPILLLKIAHAQIRVFRYQLPQLLCKYSEAVSRRCSVKKLFLKIQQNSQEKPVLESHEAKNHVGAWGRQLY